MAYKYDNYLPKQIFLKYRRVLFYKLIGLLSDHNKYYKILLSGLKININLLIVLEARTPDQGASKFDI